MLLFFCFFLSVGVCAQGVHNLSVSEPVLKADSAQLATSVDYLLFVHSSHRCGFCWRLKNAMADENLPKNLRVVFVEYDTPEDWILDKKSSYLGSEVRRVADKETEIRLFPHSQLVHADDSSKVKDYKGYYNGYWPKVGGRCRKQRSHVPDMERYLNKTL